MIQGGNAPFSNPPFWIRPLSQGVGVGVPVAVVVAVGVGVELGVPVGVAVGVADEHGTTEATRARRFRPWPRLSTLRGGLCPPVASQTYSVKSASSRFTPITSWLV